ncbi:MAG: ROK family transcriptional regulator [Clostridia bacterium]|nr:ROK family transcriptional regulator [Clostridia bacterium]
MNKQVANVQLMQKMNRLKVLQFVRRNPDISRPVIAAQTGLSLPSITNIVSYLLELGILCESGTEQVSRVGRKSTLLRFSASAYDLVCIYLDEKHANIFKTDLEGNPKEKITLTIKKNSPEESLNELCEATVSMVGSCKPGSILGIGVAISGLVLSDSRFIMSSRLKWKSFDIKNMLEEETGIPVFLDNVSLLRAVWYFSKKAPQPDDNMLFLDMENGIGAVQYAGGVIQSSTLGEIGHTTVERDGLPCFCGNRGCLEAMCSPKRLLSLYESANEEPLTSLADIESLYQAENDAAVFSVRECACYLGIGLANLVNLFNPSVIVINTGDFKDCPSLLQVAEEELRKRAYLSLSEHLTIEKINETEENTVCGTAYHLCNKLFDISFPKNIIE